MKMIFRATAIMGLVTSALCTSLSASTVLVHLGSNDIEPIRLTKGFSEPEGSHRWTNGTEAELQIPVFTGTESLRRVIFKNTNGIDRNQQMTVLLNGDSTGFRPLEYTDGTPQSHIVCLEGKVEFTLDGLKQYPVDYDVAKFSFQIPNAKSPFDLGWSDDTRQLGISFTNVKLQYEKLKTIYTPLSSEDALQAALKLQKPMTESDELLRLKQFATLSTEEEKKIENMEELKDPASFNFPAKSTNAEFFAAGAFRLHHDSKLTLKNNDLNICAVPRCTYEVSGRESGMLIWQPTLGQPRL